MLKNSILKLTIADMLLILAIIASAALLHFRLGKSPDNYSAFIYYHNSLWGVYELSRPQIINIGVDCSAEIKDGNIRMIQSDCLDKRCVEQGWSSATPIICLPNKVVIELKSNKSKQDIHHLY